MEKISFDYNSLFVDDKKMEQPLGFIGYKL